MKFSQSLGWPLFHCLVVLHYLCTVMSSVAVMMLWLVGLLPLIRLVVPSSVVDSNTFAAR